MTPRIFVAFDLETTGLNPKRDAIIEFGAVRFQKDGPRQQFATCINPGRSLPLRIQQLTGIRPDDVKHAPSFDSARPEIMAFFGQGTGAVVAHSAGFDIGFLRAAGVEVQAPVLDTYELATILLPSQASYSLGELCRDLGIRLEEAHRAGHDAEATADLLLHLLTRIEALPDPVLETLCEAGRGAEWGPILLFEDELGRRNVAANGDSRTVWPAPPAASQPVHLPLDPTPSTKEIGTEFLTAAFAAGGALASEFAREKGSGFEKRDGQLNMALQTLDALNRGDHRIIEAGTGTGKSLAYLLPAAAWAAANQSRVVIATNTIPLQDQLLDKELPRVARVLSETDTTRNISGPANLRAMVLKGRSRYLCTRRLANWIDTPRSTGTLFAEPLPPLELRFLAKLLAWLPQTQSGDLSELPIHDVQEQALIARVCSHGDECSPERCFADTPPGRLASLGPTFRDFYIEAHRQARSAHLLVVNHALLVADVQAGGQVLPEFDSLIIDEAHHLESAATDQFTQQFELRTLPLVLEKLESAAAQLALLLGQDHFQDLTERVETESKALQRSLPPFVDALHEFVQRHSDGKNAARSSSAFPQQVALDSRMRTQPAWSEIEIEWDGLSAELSSLLAQVSELADLLDASHWWQSPYQTGSPLPGGSSMTFALQALHYAQTDLADILHIADDVILRPLNHQEESVASLELPSTSQSRRRGRSITLRNAPIQVSEKLASELFGRKRAVVLTGATLQAGDRFDFLRDRLGCWDANGSAIDSPFGFKRSTLLYLPTDMPPPDHQNYQQLLEEAIQQAALAAEGRTLVLFTSRNHLRASADAIRTPLAAAGLTVIQQGEGSRRRNLRDFRANPRSVLLGARSYWEGIDLPGDQLLCLIIARLPFAVPTDPLYAARSRLYEDPFSEYAVPEAVIRLRQGFGRLIRSAADRGVVVLLDSRLWERSYGQIFLDALPDCSRRQSPIAHLGEAVQGWLNKPHAPHDSGERLFEPDRWGHGDA